MARPKLEIDAKVVEALAKVGATNTEIAGHFCCDEGTIRKRFSVILTKARANRKIKLREMQWRLAEKGNLGMLVWLGKNELDQSEKQEIKEVSEQRITHSADLKNMSAENFAEYYKKLVG